MDLQKVQQANLAILKEVDRICRKYKIKYLLDAGTLIGAVRHRGFIPWDDDIDIAMTRDQYEAFKKVVERELPDTMAWVDCEKFQGGKAFYDFTSRIIYKNSQRREPNEEMEFYEGKLNHIWLDFFIIDELPEKSFSAAVTRLLHKIIYGMAMGHRYHLDFDKYKGISRLQVMALATVGRAVPMKLLFRLQRRIALKDKKGKSSKRYYSNYQPDYLYVTVEKDWCENCVDLRFEGEKFMAPAGFHQVLTEVYGDYMKLPPKEERVPSHSSRDIKVFD